MLSVGRSSHATHSGSEEVSEWAAMLVWSDSSGWVFVLLGAAGWQRVSCLGQASNASNNVPVDTISSPLNFPTGICLMPKYSQESKDWSEA